MKKEGSYMGEEIRFPFEDTEIYKAALEFAELCLKIANRLSMKYYSYGDQIKRASGSICNNYAEGYGRWHKKDKVHFFIIARGSAYECVPVFTLLYKAKQVSSQENQKARRLIAGISRMLSGLIGKIPDRKQ